MEELTTTTTGGRGSSSKKKEGDKKKKSINLKAIKDIIIKEYENPDSAAFGKSSQIIRKVILRKYPKFKNHLTEKLMRNTLKRFSTTYSITRKLKRNKFFHSTSFYSTHPHYRWHVDLQDMTMFRKAVGLSRQDAFNFLLVCVDNFSNYLMVEAIKNKQAKLVFEAFAKIVRREKGLPTIVYCDRGTEFENKIFNNKMKLGFRVQFVIDKRKAVYAERAIRTIRRALEQYYAGKPNTKLGEYKNIIQKIDISHNNAPSNRAPKLNDGINASPNDIIHNTSLINKMEKILRKR